MSPVVAIAQSGLAAATLRLSVSASNLANVQDASAVGSTAAYDPLEVDSSAAPGGGVSARAVTAKTSQLISYDPASPAASARGLVQAPEIDPISEVTNQLAAGRAFAASLAALKTAEDEQKTLLDLKT